MPLQATSGAASYDAFGGGVAAVPNYIESVFSTFLYTGNGSTQTITNGIDLAGKGGLVWGKKRSTTGDHFLVDTVRGSNKVLISNGTFNELTSSVTVTGFNSNGFGIGAGDIVDCNNSGGTYASWTFRKQPKFFDVVTYTGTGSVQNVAHSLGSVPGCIIVKRINDTQNWRVYHRSLGSGLYINLDQTDAASSAGAAFMWNNTDPTSTVFTVNSNSSVNASGSTYVAYIFAHNAGGFGLSGTDNVISCGSFTTTGGASGTFVDLGFEPQWILTKRTNSTGDWTIIDNMRGSPVDNTANVAQLFPNSSNAELTDNSYSAHIQSTGFNFRWINNTSQFIYIAIRRGPMRTPTTGTSVFSPNVFAGAAGTQINTSFPVDMQFLFPRDGGFSLRVLDRLRGVNSTNGTLSTPWLATANTAAEANGANTLGWNNTGFQMTTDWQFNLMSFNNFRRAPGFFDVVCYTGTGSARTVAHNLTVVPELMIVKVRNDAQVWQVYSAATGNAARLQLNTNDSAFTPSAIWNTTTPTSSVFSVGTNVSVNGSGQTYVAYLFASAPGVSKVTNFTGNGSSQTINCGFTSGARFVMIKATSTTGNWTVFDSARGISAGGDPALYLNSTAAEVTGVDAIDADSTGFIVNQEGTFNLNASGVQYLVLAIS